MMGIMIELNANETLAELGLCARNECSGARGCFHFYIVLYSIRDAESGSNSDVVAGYV